MLRCDYFAAPIYILLSRNIKNDEYEIRIIIIKTELFYTKNALFYTNTTLVYKHFKVNICFFQRLKTVFKIFKFVKEGFGLTLSKMHLLC